MFRRATLVPSLAFAILTGGAAGQAAEPDLRGQLETLAQPFVKQWCAGCHSGAEPESGLHLPDLFRTYPGKDAVGMLRDLRGVLHDEEMPPEDEPAPPDEDRRKMVQWLDQVIAETTRSSDPGRVPLRRLSRVEYRNTVRDLFDVREDVTREFPADDLGYGFDNIGGSTSISALHVERYAAAARRIARHAVVTPDHETPQRRVLDLEALTRRGRITPRGDTLAFASRGRVEFPVDTPRAGLYRLKIRAYGQQAGSEPARLGVWIGGRQAKILDVPAERGRPGTYQVELHLPGGKSTLAVGFVNDFYDPKAKDRRRRDRNLYLEGLAVSGPHDPRTPTAAHRWIFAGDPGVGVAADRARPLIPVLLRRVWRRPATEAEIDRVCRLVSTAVDAGDSFSQGIQLALEAALVSPHFLFRIESGTRAKKNGATTPRTEALDDHSLATRLSYFLWSSPPDAVLARRADRGELQDPAVLAAEARRMLQDPKSAALATNFAAQWLELRSLDNLRPDAKRFPAFTDELRTAMHRETEMFFTAVLREDLPASTLLDASFTFLNEPLAAHYGIAGVKGKAMRRIDLDGRRRGGLIGQASIQAITSNPTRTSPVKRGKWILDNLLDDPPPPPKPGTDSFQGDADLRVPATMRAQLARHREQASCAVCHNRMDALGLAMENYDAIGRWRDRVGGQPVDASGELPGGRKLDGPGDLKQALGTGTAFVRCLTKKLFLFGVGRELRGIDEVVLDTLVTSLGREATIRDVVLGVVKLDAFRRRLATRTIR